MTNLLFFGGTFWIACVIFVTDLLVPRGVAVGLGYSILPILGLWSPWQATIYWGAVVGTLFTAAGFLFSPIADVASLGCDQSDFISRGGMGFRDSLWFDL